MMNFNLALLSTLCLSVLTTCTGFRIGGPHDSLTSSLVNAQNDEISKEGGHVQPYTGTSLGRSLDYDAIKNFLSGLSKRFNGPRADSAVGIHTPLVQKVFRNSLYDKGMTRDEVEKVIDEVVKKLSSGVPDYKKRNGWSRFSVHTRFAPFGTKLVPQRQLENGGATLLRYGRSVRK